MPPPSMESSPLLAQERQRDDEDYEMVRLLATRSRSESLGAAKRKMTPVAGAGAQSAAAATTPASPGAIGGKYKDSATAKNIKLSLRMTAFGIASSVMTTPLPITADVPGNSREVKGD